MRLVQSNPPAKLSITHIGDLQRGTKGDVVQPGEAAPHDDVARRGILGPGEIAAEPGDLGQVAGQGFGVDEPASGSGIRRSSTLISISVSTRAGSMSGSVRLSIVNQNTRQLRMQNTASNLTKPLGDSQPRLFGPAARFQDLVEDLDLPAHGIPAQLLHRVIVAVDRQVSDQLPVDTGAARRLLRLTGVQQGEDERRIAFCLPIGGRTVMRRYVT